jgi:ABC-2 type transport system ATP-binding protein
VAVRTTGLTKSYGGKPALIDLDLEIRRGEIFGFIGPNGAGKTTTIRILSALLRPTSGSAEIHGVDVVGKPRRIKELVGYMPDAFGVYDNMTLHEYLDFFGAAYRIPRRQRRRVIGDVLELTDLGPKRFDQVSGFSRGMKQRACLARTLLHDPEVLILDEPASGLDPRARIEFRELLRELQNMGKTIVVSSHILTELSTICTTVGLIETGKLVAAGSVDKILSSLKTHRRFTLKLLAADDTERVVVCLEKQTGVREVKSLGGELSFEIDATEPEIAEFLTSIHVEGIRFTEFREDQVDLETAFMTLTKGDLA